MKIITNFTFLLILSLLCASAGAKGIIPMKTAWMGENEAFPVWYAKQKGLDKAAGLDISMLRFPSGKDIVDGLPAYDWAIAGSGAVPAANPAFIDKLAIIAAANDESQANAVFIRSDGQIAAQKNNAGIYGDQASLRDKTLLCPRDTSAHYLLLRWLKELYVSPKDVQIKYVTPEQALGAFSGGFGDAVALWSPLTFKAEEKGFTTAARPDNCGVVLPVFLVADRKYALEHPEQIKNFLKMYFETVEEMNSLPVESLAEEYIRFLKEWAGVVLSKEEAIRDLLAHQRYALQDQPALFNGESGKSKIEAWLEECADFYEAQDNNLKLSPSQIQKAINPDYINSINNKPD